jgi:glutamate formiminotransferase
MSTPDPRGGSRGRNGNTDPSPAGDRSGGPKRPAGLLAVVNVSEGRRAAVLRDLVEAGGRAVLDLHHDPHHHRAVLTLGAHQAGTLESAVRAVARATVEAVDLRDHRGAHPRFGVLDVVPFVPLVDGHPAGPGDDLAPALAARDRFCTWAADELAIPCFRYGPERSLPEVRRHAFADMAPDRGPAEPHPTAGACAVGARPALVAYNLWLRHTTLEVARAVAAAVRGPAIRALGLAVGDHVQVSCNLVDPYTVGPATAFARVADAAAAAGAAVARAELVGLVPAAVADAVPEGDRQRVDMDDDRTVEGRLGPPPPA